jgi:predicted metallo-beta-lactamase superfamily hydrolase
LKFKERISPVVDVAEECGVRVLTAAEYDGRKVEMLEALRKELYAEKFRC